MRRKSRERIREELYRVCTNRSYHEHMNLRVWEVERQFIDLSIQIRRGYRLTSSKEPTRNRRRCSRVTRARTRDSNSSARAWRCIPHRATRSNWPNVSCRSSDTTRTITSIRPRPWSGHRTRTGASTTRYMPIPALSTVLTALGRIEEPTHRGVRASSCYQGHISPIPKSRWRARASIDVRTRTASQRDRTTVIHPEPSVPRRSNSTSCRRHPSRPSVSPAPASQRYRVG